METIKFDNKEYVWEEIGNKGKCLVPYVVDPLLNLYNFLDL